MGKFKDVGGNALGDEEKLRQTSDAIFVKFDKDNSGSLSVSELDNAATSMFTKIGLPAPPSPAIKSAFKALDKDADGSLSKDEFFAFSKKLLSALPMGTDR